MIEKRDIDAAIAECLGKRNPDANTCIKLAAFYTIRDHLFADARNMGGQFADTGKMDSGYSYDPAPDQKPGTIVIDSDSEFARVIDGRDQSDIWPLMDELMDTIKTIHPKLYNAVMDRLQ